MNEQLLTAALDKALARVTDETGLVGGVVNVIRGGKTVYTYEYGYADRENKLPMTQDTLFDVASTSKAWTVMLAAQAIDDGLGAQQLPDLGQLSGQLAAHGSFFLGRQRDHRHPFLSTDLSKNRLLLFQSIAKNMTKCKKKGQTYVFF